MEQIKMRQVEVVELSFKSQANLIGQYKVGVKQNREVQF